MTPDDKALREHAERVAADYLKHERLPPYDEAWHLATWFMREIKAARAEGEQAAEAKQRVVRSDLKALQESLESLKRAGDVLNSTRRSEVTDLQAQLKAARAEGHRAAGQAAANAVDTLALERIADLQAQLKAATEELERSRYATRRAERDLNQYKKQRAEDIARVSKLIEQHNRLQEDYTAGVQETLQNRAKISALEQDLAQAQAQLATLREAAKHYKSWHLHGLASEADQRAEQAAYDALTEALAQAPAGPNYRQLYETLREAAQAAVAMYDRYCLHDMSIDEYDLGKTLEGLRAALAQAPAPAEPVSADPKADPEQALAPKSNPR